jgi:deoxyribose-phosphate aldolase
VTEIELNRMIDHTLLKPEASAADIKQLCDDAKRYNFYSACINTHWVLLVARELKGSEVKVCSIAGFPLGAVDSEVKAFEAKRAVRAGAHEIDMVMNIGALKSGEPDFVREDIARVVKACGESIIVKVIIEAAVLTDDEKVRACKLVIEAGAHFVKTSTGFGPPGANVRDVEIMRRAVGPDFGVKASAGIRTAAAALDLVRAGATRIGSSASVAIMEELKARR